MFKVDLERNELVALEPTDYSAIGLKERFNIQEWVVKTPWILGEELLVIGKEVILPSGKRLDLLCIDKGAALVIIELKRDDSGSSVEWQAIKYASYCSNFLPEEIFNQYASYTGKTPDEAAKSVEEFIDSDIEALNKSQRIILASKEFNSEVISAVLWLREFGLDIQCTRLAPYLDKDNELFIKPETIIPLPEAKDYIEKKEVKNRKTAISKGWTGYWFVNVGEGKHRTWEDNLRFGYISAGQGLIYSKALKRLSVGDKIFAYMKGVGYVGFGEVQSESMMIKDFIVENSKPLLECDLKSESPDENSNNELLSEYAIKIDWIKTFSVSEAKTFSGIFANQNVVCKLRHESTLNFLLKEFK
ncbi:hypothetical protein [Pseudoalteromonas sp. McH1-42]|uniref:hypothetical protein n=1 Tax=Pseudoalteromonas sp. McH1-42 TaxID=2917752 RepID=UPI001EF62170|nr:hypothetical protein [Pseudoalteromonas sp. McH1-42]MCG7561001.1 hypothetical protein [Pseudoalteromonas sp. McH1-42]